MTLRNHSHSCITTILDHSLLGFQFHINDEVYHDSDSMSQTERYDNANYDMIIVNFHDVNDLTLCC